MKTRSTATRIVLAAALGAGVLIAPATIAPVTAAYADDAAICEVSGGTMNWGVIERWRAYISGNIAAGGWETSDGATYETPEFGWSNPTGEIDADTGAGTISFTGGVRFTGHDGALDTTFANPTIRIDENGNGTLLLDVQSLGRDGGPDVSEQQVEMGDLGAVGTIDAASGSYSLDGAAMTLTERGSEVFTAYEPGLPMDPLTLNVEIAECAGGEPSEAVEETEEPAAGEDEESTEPAAEGTEETGTDSWLPIALIAGSVLIVVIGGAMLYAAKRSKKNAAAEPGQSEQPEQSGGDSAPEI